MKNGEPWPFLGEGGRSKILGGVEMVIFLSDKFAKLCSIREFIRTLRIDMFKNGNFQIMIHVDYIKNDIKKVERALEISSLDISLAKDRKRRRDNNRIKIFLHVPNP